LNKKWLKEEAMPRLELGEFAKKNGVNVEKLRKIQDPEFEEARRIIKNFCERYDFSLKLCRLEENKKGE
jgi:hypothetical protein